MPSAAQGSAAPPLLDIQGLKTYFDTEDGVVKAVDGLDLVLQAGSTLGIVGESGSGKSVTSLSVMRLVPMPPGRFAAGRILFEGADLLAKSEAEMRSIRGNKIAMVFQDPMTALNPVLTIGDQIAEAILLHQTKDRAAAKARAIEMLTQVRIPDAAKRYGEYPHQLSGGMRQRVMIAMALSCNPALLIADEPTTALDVTIQAQILDLMMDLQREFNSAILLITHNLGIVAEICRDVAVMYAGTLVERTDTASLFARPKHPYTWGLLKSIPRLDDQERRRLVPIPGQPPSLKAVPPGCAFADRCPEVMPRCRERRPELREVEPGHWVRCYLYEPAAVSAP